MGYYQEQVAYGRDHPAYPSMSNPPLILYVEDNPDNRKLVTRLLMAYEFHIHAVADGPAGLAFAAESTPNLILLDISMPGMDGYEVIHRLRQMEHLAAVPIIALTANVMKEDQRKSAEAGFDGFIQKPISIDTFPEQLMAYMKVAK
ncbi:MAG: response regulator [Chloroflexi bacterium]|nr:response regulator [Chloroflexota bacterium]